MAQAPTTPADQNTRSPDQRGVFLTVDDIERLSKSFRDSIKPDASAGSASCGVIVCGNGAAV